MAISRMQFLRGRFRAEAPALRPPWALAEEAFLLACERCDACIQACPNHILHSGSGRFPEVDFSRGECTFCGDCVTACPTKALDKAARQNGGSPWTYVAHLKDNCLAKNGVVCRTCGEVCEPRAIRFAIAVISQPVLQLDDCTGCGACVAPCPVGAIAISAVPAQA